MLPRIQGVFYLSDFEFPVEASKVDMNRRRFLAFSAALTASSMLLTRGGFASSCVLWQDQQLSETQLKFLLQSWLDAFNADNPTSYRAFITKYDKLLILA